MLLAASLLVLPFVALIILKLVRTLFELRARRLGYITFGVEDRYQALRSHTNVHDAIMVARVQLDMSEEAFEALIGRVESQFRPWVETLERSIEHRPAVFEAPLDIRETRGPGLLTETPVLARIIIARQEQEVILLGNHVYLGGFLLSQFVQIVFCERITTGIFPRNRYFPLVTEALILALLARLALRKPRTPPRVFERVGDIQRYYLRQSRDGSRAIAAELGVHETFIVIAHHIQQVLTRLGRDNLRVTLPISFEDHSSFNTVGALFLDVSAQPSFGALVRFVERSVKRSQWQVSASNHVQRIFPSHWLSQKARDTVHLTLTVVPQRTLPKNILTKEMREYEFTMNYITYPIYVMAFIFDDRIHSSYLVNSPDFDAESFMAEDGATRMNLELD